MIANPLQRAPLYRQIYDQLEAKIVNRELKVGDALPSETDLALSYGVHRSSIREAIRLLEENDLIGRAAGKKKLLVTAPKKDKLSRRISTTMLIDEVSLGEVYEAILTIEPSMAAMAAERVTPELLEKLEANLDTTREALNDPERLTALDQEFHNLLAEASKNRALQWSRLGMSGLFYPAERKLLANLKEPGKRMLVAHEHIVGAIKDRDKQAAELWARRHIEDFLRGCNVLGVNLGDMLNDLAQGN
ncbi:FadR/GntR family transcriptional regulator [Colwellia sp. 20A7]|uniref:FadR/GntR family transcriptional regulator n=1 Tax=Colwellia sp. 20A7 TaxID=2689569 RepID=UPI0013579619|nr:FCD domain-containing protein [Colwellia sp. 20A7]